jgi:hypothetical protein
MAPARIPADTGHSQFTIETKVFSEVSRVHRFYMPCATCNVPCVLYERTCFTCDGLMCFNVYVRESGASSASARSRIVTASAVLGALPNGSMPSRPMMVAAF